MMRVLIWSFVAALAALGLGDTGSAWAQERYALVIGNSAYEAVPQLPNPVRDASAISTFLKSAGFDVTTALDVDQTSMRRAVVNFAQQLATKGDKAVALLYFAGHGVQVNGENYLVPVDARIGSEADVPLQAVRFADIMDTLEQSGKKTRLVFLDACRNNPFGDGKTPQGLAMVNVPPGSLVVYSTSPGSTAEDGSGGNSPFTEALLSVGRNPGEPIEDALKDVRLSVNKETVGRQVPWDVSSLIEPFSFFPGAAGTPAPTQVNAPASGQSATPTTSGRAATTTPGGGSTSGGGTTSGGAATPAGTDMTLDTEQAATYWRARLKPLSMQQAHDIALREDKAVVYRVYLELFPQSQYVVQFRTLLDRRVQMWAWFEAVTLNTVAAYDAYLRLYPEGDLANTARRLMERARLRSLFPLEVPGALGPIASAAPTAASVVSPTPAGGGGTPEVRTVVQTVVKEVPVEKVVTVEVPAPCRCVGPGANVPPIVRGHGPIVGGGGGGGDGDGPPHGPISGGNPPRGTVGEPTHGPILNTPIQHGPAMGGGGMTPMIGFGRR